jgi:spore coat polysaccharide biosynthesis predicted glycosyltransferase SpsG
MSPTVLLRAASGAKLGAGHVRRARAVAQALAARGARPCFVVDDQGTLASLASEGFEALSAERDPRWWSRAANAVWLDGPGDWSEILLALRETRTLLVESRLGREAAHAVLQPALHWEPDAWERAHHERVLGGAPWIPLSTEVLAETPLARSERDLDLLVTFGASDPYHLTETVLAALAGRELRLVVTLGEHMLARRTAIEGLCASLPNAQLLIGAQNLAPWMRRSLAAVTAVGTTLYELAYLRVSAWILAHHPRDRAALQWYGQHGPHAPLGIAGDVSTGALALLSQAPPKAAHWPEGLGAGAGRLAAWLCGSA